MKKTLLASLIASSLALTGCWWDNPKEQTTSQQLAVKTASLEKAYAAIATGDNPIVAQGDTIKQAIAKIEARIKEIKETNESEGRTKDLAAMNEHLTVVKDIQKVIRDNITATQASKMVADADSTKLNAKFAAFGETLEKDNEALRISDIAPMVELIDAIAQIDKVAATDDEVKKVFKHLLNEQYEAIDQSVDKLMPTKLADFDADLHKVILEMRAYVDLIKVNGQDNDFDSFKDKLQINDGAYKFRAAVTKDTTFPKYVEGLEKVLGDLKAQRRNEGEIVAAIVAADEDVGAFIQSFAHKTLSAELTKQIQNYNGTPEENFGAFAAVAVVDTARLQAFAERLHHAINVLPEPQ